MHDSQTVLMSRDTAGLHVRLKYLSKTDMIVIEANTEQAMRAATVPPEKALDAFHHPMLYLPEPEEFFRSQPTDITIPPSAEGEAFLEGVTA